MDVRVVDHLGLRVDVYKSGWRSRSLRGVAACDIL